ncbi:nuclear distribution nude [Trichoderma cornu-damae]|uniref:Nuclear distribution nude n=1 Tax=Trichoderma cornu-damae TaxID=654480 RepID=A0A9P8QKC7_9HYPO|nr:nuclear distribution nude [Trichoderma cornu-damae]
MAEPPSSPPSEAAGAEDTLSWYKAQYELLESELAEFRESSRELEQELEKDIERAEKQERILKEKADALRFEVEEWKRKYKESKAETTTAQASLEKEITTLREANRTLALKLRDSEVANDDFERQARNTTSSLEDMESKFNQAVERGVLMEEEIKMGEQEREALRIESQRLREELSELKIEAELMQDKVKKYESRHSTISSDISILESPTFDKNADASADSAASSPLITTPPEVSKALGEPTIELLDPPSPPMSDASAHTSRVPSRIRTPAPTTLRRTRLPSVDASSRARGAVPAPATGTRVVTGGRLSISNGNSGGGAPLRTPAANRSSVSRNSNYKIPASNSLSHIRLLTAQMQRLEARVHSVRSKLPAPNGGTPPRPSSRPPVVAATPSMPSTLTVRSRKRATTQSTASSSFTGDDLTPTSSHASSSKTGHMPRLSTSGVSRLSFGTQPNGRGTESEVGRPTSRSSLASSQTSYARPVSRNDMAAPPRPISRSSFSGTRTPIGRPASSFGNSVRGHSGSVSGTTSGIDLLGEEYEGEYRTPSRRGTFSRYDLGPSASSIPTPGSGIPMLGSGIPGPTLRRQSGSRRISLSTGSTGGVPIRSGRVSTTGFRKLGDLGETY